MKYSIFVGKNNSLSRSVFDIQGVPICAGMPVRVVQVDIARHRFSRLSQINLLYSVLNEVHTVDRIDDEGKIWITRFVESNSGERQRHLLSLSGKSVLLEHDWAEELVHSADNEMLVA